MQPNRGTGPTKRATNSEEEPAAEGATKTGLTKSGTAKAPGASLRRLRGSAALASATATGSRSQGCLEHASRPSLQCALAAGTAHSQRVLVLSRAASRVRRKSTVAVSAWGHQQRRRPSPRRGRGGAGRLQEDLRHSLFLYNFVPTLAKPAARGKSCSVRL